MKNKKSLVMIIPVFLLLVIIVGLLTNILLNPAITLFELLVSSVMGLVIGVMVIGAFEFLIMIAGGSL